jgi:hypothetical protein
MGDAAVGMCIDFYGRSYHELYRDPATGESRIEFVMPRGGTSIGADPIGLLRGAPHPELAHHFIEFVLSPEGQKIWNYRVGAPGGPTRHALRRPPIRRDFYVEANFPHMTDPTFDPYRAAEGFTYHPEWTGSLFAPLRFVIRAACMDPHEEQIAAWEALVAAGLPAEGVAAFEAVEPISYEAVVQQIGPALKNSDKVAQVRRSMGEGDGDPVSPHPRSTQHRKRRVGREDRHAMRDRLCGDKAVEGVRMNPGQLAAAIDCIGLQSQPFKAVELQLRRQPLSGISGKGEFPR